MFRTAFKIVALTIGVPSFIIGTALGSIAAIAAESGLKLKITMEEADK